MIKFKPFIDFPRPLHTVSPAMTSLLTFVTLALLGSRAFAIGPVATLKIVNGNVSPDGYSRA